LTSDEDAALAPAVENVRGLTGACYGVGAIVDETDALVRLRTREAG
jgi:hypothetical protein